MNVSRRQSAAIIFTCVMMISIAAVASDFEDGDAPSQARISADELMVFIVDPEAKVFFDPSEDIYKVFWTNDTRHEYSVDITNSSYSSPENFTVVWTIQAQSGVDSYYTFPGSVLNHSYHVPGVYWINVSAEDPDEKTGNTTLKVTVKLDIDDDGIPDWWEIKYFGDTSIADGSSNYDGDSFTDLQEFQRGSDPTVFDEPDERTFLESYWYLIVVAVAAAAFSVIYLMFLAPMMKRRREESEKKKIAAAIEIEKALELDLGRKKK
ncbi:MAG TPA: hypothetical protein ENN25_00160 [Euryarchaeota archaeon]|nr:hypothetical protein [Euryarchaeota archaeon]